MPSNQPTTRPRSSRIQTELGTRLRSFREGAGLTQRQVAERCDLDPQTIHRYEAGLLEPTASVLQVLGRALGQEPITMMELSGLLLLSERTERQLATLARRGFRIWKSWRGSMPDHYYVRICLRDDPGNLITVSGEGPTSTEAIDSAMLQALKRAKARDYTMLATPGTSESSARPARRGKRKRRSSSASHRRSPG